MIIVNIVRISKEKSKSVCWSIIVKGFEENSETPFPAIEGGEGRQMPVKDVKGESVCVCVCAEGGMLVGVGDVRLILDGCD